MEGSSEPLKLHLVQHYRQDYCGPYFNGIYVQALKKGDIVSFTGSVGGYTRVVATLRITHPKQSGVEVVRVVRLGGLSVEISANELGLGPGARGHFVVRGEIEGKSELGWIGVGGDVCLTPSFKLELARSICLNGVSIFPTYSGFCYPYF